MNRIQKIITAIGLIAAALSYRPITAEKFVLTDTPATLDDWKSGSFYLDGKAPSGAASDIIALKEDLEVEVNAADTEIIEFLEAISYLTFQGEAIFALNVEQTCEFSGKVKHNDDYQGRFEKRGDGHLKLMSTGLGDYQVDFFVMGGTVTLPPCPNDSWNMYDRVWIARGAKIHPMTGTARWQIKGLSGDGELENTSEQEALIYITPNRGHLGPYNGKITGKITIELRNGTFEPTCSDNKYTGVMTVNTASSYGAGYATLALNKIGKTADITTPSGPGSAKITLAAGSRLLYTGSGETTDRTLIMNYASGAIIDGGTNGWLNFAGNITHWTATASTIGIILQGENPHPCTFSGIFSDYYGQNENNQYTAYFTKRGTGEWNFPDNRNLKCSGVFAVEDGTLSFESITRKSVRCSLGTADKLFRPVAKPTTDDKTDYAFLLGSSDLSQCGYLSCTNSLSMQCFDRPFGLKGRGGFSADFGLVKYANVFGASAGAKTLMLKGSNRYTNEVHDIADGKGVVSVVKRGTGTWLLGGDLTFSGDISVEGGTLIVRRAPQAYSRYRLLIMECSDKNPVFREKYAMSANTNSASINIHEIALYSQDNARQNLGLQPTAEYVDLKAGECCWGWGISTLNGIAALGYAFDGKRYNGNSWHAITESIFGLNNGFFAAGGKGKPQLNPSLEDPSSWICVDMHLPAGAKEIHHFDISTSASRTTNQTKIPTTFQLLGSVDGVHWEKMSKVETASDLPGGTYYWLSNLSHTGENLGNRSGGWTVTNSTPMHTFSQLVNVSSVKVSGGAKFIYDGDAVFAPALNNLKVDAASVGGSIDGFAFAAEGAIDVTPAQETMGTMTLPVKIENISGSADFSKWNVSLGGHPTATKRMALDKNGNIALYSYGMTVVVR